MKTKFTLSTLIIAFLAISNLALTQTLFKDCNPGTNSSNPDQYFNVNGTMYFITNNNPTYLHQLWKSDGTTANTVMVKDSLIITNIGGIITFINFNNSLFYLLNKNGSSTSATISELWKTDGTAAGTVLIKTLTNANPLGGSGDAPPSNYVVAGNNLFFQFGSGHGLELWVSDGTGAGTMEVVDLNPGNNGSGYNYGGVNNKPMIAYNGKVFFQGSATAGGSELYCSDGTAAGTTLVKGSPTLSDPQNFFIYNNGLYFQGHSAGNDGLWKTDGTTVGTVSVTSTPFNSDAKIFNNAMYYSANGTLWKSDGTTGGTVAIKDSVGGMTGMLSNMFYTSYMKYLSYAPYYTMYYWQSDGTAAGTTRISKKIGKAASFWVLNNKMYNAVADSVGYTSGLWESDGTLTGTTDLFTGYLSYPYIFNSTVFFTNSVSTSGYEVWSLTPSAFDIATLHMDESGLRIYPNPSAGKLQISLAKSITEPLQITVTDLLGKEVYSEKFSNNLSGQTLDLSHLQNGIYLVHANNEHVHKVIIQK